MKTTLTVDINYDGRKTDPEALASAMDRLLETALSTPGLLDEYANPAIGEFFVAKETDRPKVVLNIHGGLVQDVFASPPDTEVVRIDWDCEGAIPDDKGIVEIPDEHTGARLVSVVECWTAPLTALAGSDCEKALQAAGFEGYLPDSEPAGITKRWVIYDPDAGALLTTRTFASYDEACEDAAGANDVLVLPLVYPTLFA